MAEMSKALEAAIVSGRGAEVDGDTVKVDLAAIKAAAAEPVPLPALPGAGEVVAQDPFPKTARSVDETPPVRDNGSGSP
jgi:hypothetical protein